MRATTMAQRRAGPPELPTSLRLFDIKDLKELTGLCEASILKGMREGWFPRPRKIGKRLLRWQEAQLVKWINACPTAEYAPLTEGAAASPSNQRKLPWRPTRPNQ